MAVKVCGLLLFLVGLTVYQERRWQSDLMLWEAAAAVNTTGPRPAYNLALALRRAHRYTQAASWLVKTLERAVGDPQEAAIRVRVQGQFAAIEMEGFPVCDLPFAAPYCY